MVGYTFIKTQTWTGLVCDNVMNKFTVLPARGCYVQSFMDTGIFSLK